MTAAPHFVVADSAKDPDADIWFAEPAGFTALPLESLVAPPGSPAADELRTAFVPFLEAAPDGLARQQLVAQVAAGQQMLGALREVGTVHCSIGLHRDDVAETGSGHGPPLISLFTLSWRDTAVAPRAVTAARAVTSAEVRTQTPNLTPNPTHIDYLELPCGPASISETVRSASADSGLPQSPLLQIHAHLPHLDCKRLVVLTLSTTAVARREQYRAVLQQIAESVSFENPFEQAATSETG
ncbi:hypothetical protein ACFWFF_08600 [Streptomyces sp. NPDC060223]|uniref:hypothetical protein n=1 Tax=unclassified Streptomyces TaxID=2593676 RepID=UPI00362DAF65